MKKITSFSGGLTSACLSKITKDDKDSVFLYLDTGAEHPETYNFIRKVNAEFNLNLVCLRPIVRNGRKSSDYKVVPVSEIGCDLIPITDVMKKYGKPSFSAASCTREMKKTLADKWRKDNFPDGSEMWIGIRADEPARYWGDNKKPALSTIANLKSCGLDSLELLDLFRTCRKSEDQTLDGLNDIFVDYSISDAAANLVVKRLAFLKSEGLHYLAEISDIEKQDTFDIWDKMPFTLNLKGDHLGNCVFCVKKSINKIALAIRDEPELYEEWKAALSQANLRADLPKIHELQKGGIIYRGNNNLDSIIAKFAHLTRDELAMTVRSNRKLTVAEDGGCSESCEAF